MKKYKVYMHTNTSNDKKYIGITSQRLNSRFRDGQGYDLGYSRPTYFFNAICKHGWDNFETTVLASGLSADEAKMKEIELIREYNTNNRQLGYNISEGGDVRVGRMKLSKEERKRRSDYMRNRVVSDETRKKMSEAKKDYIPWNKGKTGIYSEERLAKLTIGKKVVDAYGNIFKSIKACAEHYGIDRGNLNAYVTGRVNMPKKYKHLGIEYYNGKE